MDARFGVATMAALLAAATLSPVAGQQSPNVSQALSVRPRQAVGTYDDPQREVWSECKLERVKDSRYGGWIVLDDRGLMVRRFLDTNGDNVIDHWSFFLNGQEAYRDIDSDFNGKADQARWFRINGARWGADRNEDGSIDAWQMISAEEASAEAIAAIATKDFPRLRRVLLSEEEAEVLGLDGAARKRVTDMLAEAPDAFRKTSAQTPKDLSWVSFDGHNAMAVPGSEIGASSDLILYQNATIIAQANGRTTWFRAPEVVRVGDVWKLTAAPSPIREDDTVDAGGVLIPSLERVLGGATGVASDETVIENTPEVRALIEQLDKHDGSIQANASMESLANYHVKRAELCARVGAASREQQNREHWYRQAAESLMAAVQSGRYPQGIKAMRQYADRFAQTEWGGSLAPYYEYRALNAEYAMELAEPKADHAKVQQGFLKKLETFLEKYPKSSDTADALWQLGNAKEFAGELDAAKSLYSKLNADFPDHSNAARAGGALRRLDGQGRQFQLVGDGLTSFGRIDTSRLGGRVLVVNYWATWCDPCKEDMPTLAKLRKKFARQGFEVVSVCVDSNKNDALEYVRQNGYDWPMIFEEGALESPPAARYGVVSLPFMMLIDEKGRIVNANLHSEQLLDEVEKAMTKKVASRSK